MWVASVSGSAEVTFEISAVQLCVECVAVYRVCCSRALGVLQCTGCMRVLQCVESIGCVAACCNMLQRVAAWCSV